MTEDLKKELEKAKGFNRIKLIRMIRFLSKGICKECYTTLLALKRSKKAITSADMCPACKALYEKIR